MVDIIVRPEGSSRWEINLVGTPMESTLHIVKQYALGEREASNKLFNSEERFEEEKSDKTAVHAWAVASDWVNYEKALDSLTMMRKQSEDLDEIKEVIWANIARMLVPHLDDPEFMGVVTLRARELLQY